MSKPNAQPAPSPVEELRAAATSEVSVCELAECEQFREWLSGQKAEADKRARQAEAERDAVVAEWEEERRTSDALRKNRDQLHDELSTTRAELDEAAHALTVTGEKLEAVREQRGRAEDERDEARAEAVRRVAVTLVAATDEDAQQVLTGMLEAVRTARPDLAIDYTAYTGSLLDNIWPEAERLREQVKRVRARHRSVAAHMGDPDDDDNLITACSDCEVPSPCPTIRALDGGTGATP